MKRYKEFFDYAKAHPDASGLWATLNMRDNPYIELCTLDGKLTFEIEEADIPAVRDWAKANGLVGYGALLGQRHLRLVK